MSVMERSGNRSGAGGVCVGMRRLLENCTQYDVAGPEGLLVARDELDGWAHFGFKGPFCAVVRCGAPCTRLGWHCHR